jgi:hypothetical protein
MVHEVARNNKRAADVHTTQNRFNEKTTVVVKIDQTNVQNRVSITNNQIQNELRDVLSSCRSHSTTVSLLK